MHTSSLGRFYFPPGPKWFRVRRVRPGTAAESVCGLDMKQSLSQPTKYIPLTVHKAPKLTKLQAASYVGVRYTWPLELARETELRWKNHLFLLEVEILCGAVGYPLRRPRLEDTVLDAHTREPTTVLTERYLSILHFCRWSQPGHNQKLAQSISEIRVEKSHSMFCTNCHKVDITTGYCSWVEIHLHMKKQLDLVCFTDT